MIKIVTSERKFAESPIIELWDKSDDQVLAFRRLDLVFVFNFHPNKSFSDYGILTEPGKYDLILSSDDKQYGGFGFVQEEQTYFTQDVDNESEVKDKAWLRLYIPSRTALVLKKVD